MRSAVFLDRDGVLTRSLIRDGKPVAPWTLGEFEIIPGTREQLSKLRDAGFALIVVTNQPDVSAGRLDPGVLEEMHRQMADQLPLDAIKVCCHVDRDQCACRKPKPGMLLEGALELQIALGRSFMVGDRWRDIEAGRAAGCKTILIDYGYAEIRGQPDYQVKSLAEAADLILELQRSEPKL